MVATALEWSKPLCYCQRATESKVSNAMAGARHQIAEELAFLVPSLGHGQVVARRVPVIEADG